MTKFVPKLEKKCDIHFKKECDITYKEEVETQHIRVCTEKPERNCDLTEEEKKMVLRARTEAPVITNFAEIKEMKNVA